MPQLNNLHPDFRLNGQAFGSEDLKEVAYSLIKEGESFELEIGDFLLDWLSDSPDVAVQTSGTTGTPDVRRLLKHHMIQSALATGRYFNLAPRSSALLCLPARYIAGKMMLVRAMVLGLALDYVAPSSAPLAHVGRPYDFCAMVPLQFLNSLDKMDHIGKLIIGGAALGEQGVAAAQVLNTQVYETFGMTETISHIALRRINPPEALFQTLPGIRLEVDERGCLVVYAPEIAPAPIHSNDLVKLYSETSFEWLGRFDNIVNSGGIKLVPEQIEQKLRKLLAMRFFVGGIPDADLGQRLVLVVEADVPPEGLLEKVSSLKSLSPYEIPKAVRHIPKFVNTENGKLNRAATLIQIIQKGG